MAQIGLKNLYYAPITSGIEENEVYDTPVRLAKAITANVTVNVATAKNYADDGADSDIHEFVDGTITLEVNKIGSAAAAALLGAHVDANGALVSSAEDQALPVAIGFQSRNANGGYTYTWLYRVTFSVPSDSFRTKGENIEFANPTIEGTFVRMNSALTLDGNEYHPWRYRADSAEGADSSLIASWFTAVPTPGTIPLATATALTISNVTLSPAFNSSTVNYTGTTTSTSGTITVTAPSGQKKVITVNGDSIASGGTATWQTGTNEVVITISAGTQKKTYKVTVTKS